ncbi:MAG: flavin reductase family protein [Candidatus Latescibacterota bacterium]|nr:flavin reductase family protein [Candidatus Latescibacterota bacterium]RKY72685.1 MAG: flavin reductase family protein [Candidatus Latescibacterota bacterium]
MTEKKALPPTWRNLWPLPATTVLVSCVGKTSRPNIITIGGCGIASSKPPLISLAIGAGQYSLKLIKETGDFVVNVPSCTQVDVTDWCGSVSGKRTDKFAEGGLTPGRSDKVKAPYVAECPVNYECKVWKIVHCGSHDLVLGEILQVRIPSDALNEAGDGLDPAKFDPLVSLQLEYRSLGRKVGTWAQARKAR